MADYQPTPDADDNVVRPTNNLECLEHERITHGKKLITTDHANIHKGLAYSYANKFTIANGASAYIEILTPASSYIHFKPVSIQTDGPKILVQLIEAPTTTPGTAQTPANRRRVGSPPAATTIVRINPTGVSGGTVLDQDYVGGGTGVGGFLVSGGMALNDNEWVLKPGVLYLVKVTNNGTASSDVNIKVFFYEEPSA